jgi:hypothetical protein
MAGVVTHDRRIGYWNRKKVDPNVQRIYRARKIAKKLKKKRLGRNRASTA